MTAQDVLAAIGRVQPPSTAALRRLRRTLSKDLANCGRTEVLKLANEIIDTQRFRWFAYEIVKNHAPTAGALSVTEVKHLGRGISDWGSVDCFACFICGPAWRAGLLSDRLILTWTTSKDRWWRRAALVSTVPLNVRAQGGQGDPVRTLAVCEKLLDDRDDMVVKALSWALRALSVRDGAAVQRFVSKHKARLAALVTRQVRHKMERGRL
ncbi:MAG TPA: DNA alkylation repair protein [Bryobacteraceae bacterium]|nr:DNA alkylation repair protein [Bryobacteraceae bacterium]